MELLSNCCGARVDGLNADNIGICSECKEGCGVEKEGLDKWELLGMLIDVLYKEETKTIKKTVDKLKVPKTKLEGCGVEEVNHSAHISPEIKEWMGENPYTGIIDRKPQTPELSKLSEQKE